MKEKQGFHVIADLKEIATVIDRKRGVYALGKTPLEDPLEWTMLGFRALPDIIEFNASIDIPVRSIFNEPSPVSADTLKSKVAEIVDRIFIKKNGLRRIRNLVCLFDSDPETAEPSAVIGVEMIAPALGPPGFAEMLNVSGLFGGPFKPPKPTHCSVIIGMGNDRGISMKPIPIDGNITNAFEKFFGIYEVLINGLYAALAPSTRPGNQPFVLRPVHLNPEKEAGGLSLPFQVPGQQSKNDLERVISVEKPIETFDDIGGQKEAKRLVQGLDIALRHPGIYQRWGTHAPKGVLLSGPPGTGKTLLAKALANATSAKFYHIKITDILSVWHGKSEEHIDQVFNIAKENAPSIIFFDELDAVGHDRNFSGSEISRRLVAILLQNLDGLEALEKVIVIGATNRLSDIDPALQRAGRFSRKIAVDMPDDEGIDQILRIHIRKSEIRAGRNLFDIGSFAPLITKLKNMSGADIEELVRRTLEEKARLDLVGQHPGPVSTADFEKEIIAYERLKRQESGIGFSAKPQPKRETERTFP